MAVVVVIWPFSFFFWCSMSQFFWLEFSICAHSFADPGAGQLKQTSALVQLRILVNFGQNFAERVRLAPDNNTPSALHGLFSKIDSLHKPWTSLTHFTSCDLKIVIQRISDLKIVLHHRKSVVTFNCSGKSFIIL